MGSYFAKHMAAAESKGEKRAEKRKAIHMSDEERMQYEAGKVLLIDKPLHWTSFDVVRKIRNSIRIKKVGHAGTLDPLATGLLIVCTGKYTKQINGYMAQEKEYTGSITLGATTATYDCESIPENQKAYDHLTPAQLYDAAAAFTGGQEQLPPIYSAIKKDGVALYELARRGDEVELKARKIIIKEFSITAIELPLVYFKVVCTTGTYIRSLANDYGAALGCGGYLSALRRTRIGVYAVDNAMDMNTFLDQLEANQPAKNNTPT